MLRSFPSLNFIAIASLLAHLFVLQCVAVPQAPANSAATGDSTGKDTSKGSEGSKDWAEIIGILTIVQDHPLPSLYTFLINEYDGSGTFFRQSGCFQEAEYPGALTGFRVSIGMCLLSVFSAGAASHLFIQEFVYALRLTLLNLGF